MSKRAFGELEYAILNILKSGNRFTVKEVHKLIGEQNKYNTIMTVMLRLSEKKVLGRERVGLQYEYWLLPNTAKAPSLIERFKQMAFGIKPTEMISYLIDSEKISDQELAEIEKLIKKTREERTTES